MPPSPHRDPEALPLSIAACRNVWLRRDDLLRLGIVPLILTFLLNAWVQKLYGDFLGAIERGETPDPAVVEALWTPSILIGLASWFITIVFAVNWMRLSMLGGDAAPGLGLAISGRHVRLTALVLLVQLALGAAAGLILVAVSMIAPIPALLFMAAVALAILCVVILLRLIPVWVGVAIDAPMSFQQSWRRTAGYGLRLLGAVVLVAGGALGLQVVLTLISAVLGLLQAAPLAVLFISLVIQFGMIACFCTIFVLVYPRFVSETV